MKWQQSSRNCTKTLLSFSSFKLGDKTRETPYGNGVQQGGNMTPALFLCLVDALLQVLEKKGMPKLVFKHFPQKQQEDSRM